jgi:hypothetical protein
MSYLSPFEFSESKNTRRQRRNKQNKRIKNKTEKMNCSPAVKDKRVNTDSCFTPEIVINIRDAYNKKHPDNKIVDSNPKRVWWFLKNNLNCQKEDCWLEQLEDSTMKSNIRKFIFAPKKPPEWKSNPDEWLSNFDIEEVAKQYETSHPEFKLIGPTTIDFDTRLPEKGGKCVLEDLCRFDLARFIRAKRTKIGIVFNLDKHDQSGSHWVSLFVDIDDKYLFFFDSADNEIPPEIWQKPEELEKQEKSDKQLPLVNRIMEQGRELGIKFTFYNNHGHRHQSSNTECGMYSLFFIITLLTGETPFTKGVMSVKKRRDLFLKKKIPDKTVFGYRRLYFND